MVGEREGSAKPVLDVLMRGVGYAVIATSGLFDGPRAWWHRLPGRAFRRYRAVKSWCADATVVRLLPIDVASVSTADDDVFTGSIIYLPIGRIGLGGEDVRDRG